MEKKSILIALAVFGSSYLIGQTVARETIGTAGTTPSSENKGIVVQSVVGQPYQTSSHVGEEYIINEGFIQPTEFKYKEMKNDINVNLGVYPNPAAYKVDFKPDQELSNVTLNIMDATGKNISTEEIKALNNHTIDCSSWKNGTYFIILTGEKGEVYKSKLIIAK